MERLLKHKLLVALLAVLAVAGGGAAYAATQTGTNSRQALLNDVAKRLNVSPSKLRSALQGALIDRLQAAVKAGQITQAQANNIRQRIEKGGLPLGLFGGPRGFSLHGQLGPGGFSPGGPGGFSPGGPRGFLPGGPRGFLPGGPGGFVPGGPGLHGRLARPWMLIAPIGPLAGAAKYLGISESQLLKDLRGKTLAQTARARGKSVSGLEQAIVSAQKSRLDHLVASGAMTKAQEQRLLTLLSKKVSQLVEHAGFTVPAGAAPAGKLPFFRGSAVKPPFPGGPPAKRLLVPGGPSGQSGGAGGPGPAAGGPA